MACKARSGKRSANYKPVGPYSARSLLTIALATLAVGCSAASTPTETAATPDPCDGPVRTAETAFAAFTDARRQLETLTPAPVDESLSRDPNDGEGILSPYGDAQMDALDAIREPRNRAMLEEYDQRARWATAVTEYRDCFSADEVTTAVTVLRDAPPRPEPIGLGPVDEAPDPEPPPPPPEPVYVAPDSATLAQFVRGEMSHHLGRDPGQDELQWHINWILAEDRLGGDTPNRWRDMFQREYAGEMQLIRDRESAQQSRDTIQGGVDVLSCMSNPRPDC